MASDVPVDLEDLFVDPAATEDTWRCCLFAPPGNGKSVAAASAPAPLLIVSADRPAAYRFARKHHIGKEMREVRYQGLQTLVQVHEYLSKDGHGVRTVVLDPVQHIVDQLRDIAPKASDGDIDHSWVNRQVLNFVTSLRVFDVNVVLVTHEKLNDTKKGDGKIYPAIGGLGLINKVLAEMDFCAHIERVEPDPDDEDAVPTWIGQVQPTNQLVCKDGTGSLPARAEADLSWWFKTASEALEIPSPDESDLPFDPPAKKKAAAKKPAPSDADLDAQAAAEAA